MENKQLIEAAIKKCYEYLREDKFMHAKVIGIQTTKVDPNCHDAYMILGICFLKENNFSNAKKCFLKCLESDNLKESAYNNLSICYAKLLDHEKSINCIQKCILINPNKDFYWSHLGLQYRKINEQDKANDAFLNTLRLQRSPINLANYGAFLADNGNYKEAEKYFLESIKLDPEFYGPYVDLFHIYATEGKYNNKTWEFYEKRFETFEQLKWYKEKKIKPIKCISECVGKKCVIFCEQGLGDTLMFMRYLKELPKNLNYVLCCSKDTKKIFDVMGLKTITSLKNKKFDCCISLLSLPYILKNKYIPNVYFPYKSEIKKFNNNIGICWCGSPSHAHDKHRSISFLNFYSIFEKNNNFKIFSLVKNYSYRKYTETNEVVDLSKGVLEEDGLIDLSSNMKDIHKTIKNIIKNKISLIITVDTMIAHLALNLGIETWLLLSEKADWRWGLKDKCEWYKSNLKIFRQSKLDDWDSVIQKVRECLLKHSLKNKKKYNKKIMT